MLRVHAVHVCYATAWGQISTHLFFNLKLLWLLASYCAKGEKAGECILSLELPVSDGKTFHNLPLTNQGRTEAEASVNAQHTQWLETALRLVRWRQPF